MPLIALLVSLLWSGCTPGPDQPVEPVWGKQACEHCMMLVSDPRPAAQVVLAAGERKFFDDVGCLVEWLDRSGQVPVRAWVRAANGEGSALAQSAERAMVWALCVFVLTSALHDVLLIAALLRTSIPPQVVFFLAAANPSESARVGILASVDPELSALGPVGFWLANFLGSGNAVALAVVWPALLGGLATWRALKRTQRLDLVV